MQSVGLSCSRVGVYDVLVDPSSTGRPAHRVTLHHRRTGVARMFTGSVKGEGPSLTVNMRAAAGATTSDVSIAVHEMPESIALALLRSNVLRDDALTG